MRLAQVALAGAVLETLGWLLASLFSSADAWRSDISTMSTVGSDHAWLVLAGEAGLTIAILALAWLVQGSGLSGDHAAVGTVLLVVAGIGFAVQAMAREGGRFDPVHGPAALLAVIALACAPLVLAVPWRAGTAYGALATWSVIASASGLALFALSTAPGLLGGLCQRGAALVLTAWVASAAVRLGRTQPDARTSARVSAATRESQSGTPGSAAIRAGTSALRGARGTK
jgi:Protein of unknown function (DUF998)